MRSLWFKGEFVEPILARKKVDTIRRAESRLPEVGEEVSFCVGPRTPFAFARVVALEDVDLTNLDADRRARLLGLYANHPGPFVRICFELLRRSKDSEPPPPARRAVASRSKRK